MRTLAALGALAAMAVPALASASPAPSAKSDAQAQCRAEQKAMGTHAFKDLYGTNRTKANAFGKCVSHRTTANDKARATAQQNAAKQCKVEQATDPAAFQTKYATGKHGKNAYGKCVSQTAKAEAQKTESAQVNAQENAAQKCSKERKTNPAAFDAKYGTNGSKSNAFGKCVSALAKA